MSESHGMPIAEPAPPVHGAVLPGIWVFIFADMCAFGLFFLVFTLSRMQDPELYAASRRALDLRFGLANTLILLSSGALMAHAVRQGRAEDWTAARRSMQWALAVGGLFGISKGMEWADKIHHGIGLGTNEFFAYYFIFTGMHCLHFIGGVAVLLVLIGRCREPLPQANKLRWAEAGAAYWHMVDLLWIVLFALLYLERV